MTNKPKLDREMEQIRVKYNLMALPSRHGYAIASVFLKRRLFIPSCVLDAKATKIDVSKEVVKLEWPDIDENESGNEFFVSRLVFYHKDSEVTYKGDPTIGQIWLKTLNGGQLEISVHHHIRKSLETGVDRGLNGIFNATIDLNKIAMNRARKNG